VGKLGQQIFDERITITEDPTDCGMLGFAPFDHEGTPVTKRSIIKDGILKQYYLTRKYASRLGMQPTGNGYRIKSNISSEVQPSIHRNTVRIEPGKLSLDSMLADIKEGVYCDFSPNITFGNVESGDFSGSLYMCYKIENGNLTGRMKDLIISGNIYKLLKDNLVGLSSESEAHDFAPTFKSPCLYLRDVTISG